MSDNLSYEEGVLFGCGGMAADYAKVLRHLEASFKVVGRSKGGAERFTAETGIKAIAGGVTTWEAELSDVPEYAIVAVSVEELSAVAVRLMRRGVRHLLLEKPAGLDQAEIELVADTARETGTRVVVGYNRRFYASVLAAQGMIENDGGVKSFNFEFTEWPHLIPDQIGREVKKNWFLANSSHVVDMAFFLGGDPAKMNCFVAGTTEWHPPAAVFSGAGLTENGALFSYQANWSAPGRWGVEVLTDRRRLVFRPLEELRVQVPQSVSVDTVEIDDALDIQFKPGLLRQTEEFLKRTPHPNLCTIDRHFDRVGRIFMPMLTPDVSRDSQKS
jgi:predicted dehydrogenase